MAADEALLDGGELRLVILNVDVDVLQLSDPLAVAIDQRLAVPLGDVPIGILLVFGHCRSLLVFPRCLAVTILGPASTPPESATTDHAGEVRSVWAACADARAQARREAPPAPRRPTDPQRCGPECHAEDDEVDGDDRATLTSASHRWQAT